MSGSRRRAGGTRTCSPSSTPGPGPRTTSSTSSSSWRRPTEPRELRSMGILSKVLLFPVTGPVAGIKWSLGQVQKVVEEELTDDAPIKQELMELQMQLELGDIDDD